jgi:2'-5' RNA ligase
MNREFAIIDNIRNAYDPLVDLFQPHITLVFPFESGYGLEELKEHMKNVLEGVKTFNLVMNHIVPNQAGGNYLFLTVTEGTDEIKRIHDRLYAGILESYYKKELPYMPHLTVGCIDEENEYDKAINATKEISDLFTTIVDKILIEKIGSNGESIIEYEYNLL